MKNFSTSIQRRKRGKRTEYIARLTYYDKAGKRKRFQECSHSFRMQEGTRLLQLSIPVEDGMSGGAVFLPDTGEVIGMITSCLQKNGVSLPRSIAIPSEIIAPYVELVTFTTKREKQTNT
jgi:hypothetical protein